jgi:hypothetical protein
LLPLVRLTLAVNSRGVRIGDIAGDDVHPQALSGKR